MHQLNTEINRMTHQLVREQERDGSWHYPFETGISTDCYMIILLRTLELDDEVLIKQLAERILSKQASNGSWKLFYDEGDGNLTATVEAYYALLYSGYFDKQDPQMQKIKHFILSKGGITKVHMFTKIMLAMTGQYRWPFFPVSVEFMLLPHSFPINLFDFSVYGRANIVPILILANYEFSKTTEQSPDLTDLFLRREERNRKERFFADERGVFNTIVDAINQGIDKLIGLPEHLHAMALKRAEQYMLERIEPDGTFYSYFSSTFLMIFALLARGYSSRDSLIMRAIQGLKSMICRIDGHIHCQYTTATVWNTALMSYALQEAGVPYTSDAIRKANQYLLSRQHVKYGDWVIHNPNAAPGGWGFSNINTINPDNDDTTASLRAIRTAAIEQADYREAWDRGIDWVISMQNNDGGWAAFEKNVDKKILNLLPVEGAKDLLTDPSTVDLTGRTLEFFGNDTQLNIHYSRIQRGVNWLLGSQNKDGSWIGRWGVYIYGTWAAVTGMLAVGISPLHPSVQKGLKWLCAIQNPDGGWGESSRSDIEKRYVPLKASTRTHTAWALDALISAENKATPEINRGIKFLIEHKEKDWTASYPKGRGMAGAFYIDYHCYEYVWPLLALAHYKKKFQ
ncbi:sporulenol synthase [Scopulibacillus daqui]|uniref:Sporulenol synthase n=1 Tax=Scopulibacillus daqui TaxID=1469162 RepID=A0ABS2PX71_9BACL|nr:squalene--hopene cyclase [Scopulibacillus daqui]MBM7644160.1 sporulenol synthase [Scopulibacillus daqui]